MGYFTFPSAVLVLTAGILVSDVSLAAQRQPTPRISPAWAKTQYIVRDDSNAYLDSSKGLRKKTFVESFFDRQDQKVTAELKQDYQLRQRQFENRHSTGVMRVEEERLHTQEMSGFSKNAMKRLSKVHVKTVERRARTYGENIDGVREPVGVAVLAAALYTGRTFGFNLAGMRMENRLDAKDREASMSLLFPGLNGIKSSIGYIHGNEEHVNGSVSASLLPSVNAEVSTANKGSVSLIYGLTF